MMGRVINDYQPVHLTENGGRYLAAHMELTERFPESNDLFRAVNGLAELCPCLDPNCPSPGDCDAMSHDE